MKLRQLLIILLALSLGAAACGSDQQETVAAAPLIVVDSSDAVAAEASDSDEADGDPGATSTGAPAGQTDEELALEFTQCMRDEGVDLQDPTVNADGSIELFEPGAIRNIDANDPDVADAIEECGDLIAGASFLPGAGLDQSEIEDRLLGFAECLRDLGLDVDDPDLSRGLAGGPAAVFGDNFDPTDPANADAVQACQSAFGAGGPLGGNN